MLGVDIGIVAEGDNRYRFKKKNFFFILFRDFFSFFSVRLARASAHDRGVANARASAQRAGGWRVCVCVYLCVFVCVVCGVARARVKRFPGTGCVVSSAVAGRVCSRANDWLLRAWRVRARRPQRRRQWTAPSSLAPSDEDFTGLPAAVRGNRWTGVGVGVVGGCSLSNRGGGGFFFSGWSEKWSNGTICVFAFWPR